MQLKIKMLAVFAILCLLNACKPKASNNSLYIYSFEKTAVQNPEDSRKLITEYLGTQNPHQPVFSRDDNTVYYVDDSDLNTTFEQNLGNGNFSFSKVTTGYMNTTPQLPEREAAEKIAQRYLTEKGLYPKNGNELKLVHSGGVRSQNVINGTKAGTIVDHLLTFTYGRMIDSLPVIGAGSKIIVQVGDKGEVYGVTRQWREVTYQNRKLVAPTEMISEAIAKERAAEQIRSEFGANSRFEITSTKKSYYDGNGNILQPVYAFNTMIYMDDPNATAQPVRYLCIISMLKNSPEPIGLTALDPRAKTMIRDTRSIRDSSGQSQDRKSND